MFEVYDSRKGRRRPNRVRRLPSIKAFGAGGRRKRTQPWGLILLGIGVGACAGVVMMDDSAALNPARIGLAARGVRVIDGDTIDVVGERIRISNLDAPEMPGRARCDLEGQLALAARTRLADTLALDPWNIEIIRQEVRPKDQYGRTLARVTVGGVDVALDLIAAGVARPWRGRSSDWC